MLLEPLIGTKSIDFEIKLNNLILLKLLQWWLMVGLQISNP